MQTKYTIAAAALITALALTGTAEAGKFSGIGLNDRGDHHSSSNPISDAIDKANGNDTDFGDIFNPQPDPVINKHIDLDPPKPVIHRDLGLDFGKDDNAGAPAGNGGMSSYAKVAKVNIGLKLNCAVAGTPVEFPDDLVIANAGLIEVPAGTQIQWQIAAAGQSGIAVLAKTLKPGKSAKFDGVLAGGIQIGTACAITAIGH